MVHGRAITVTELWNKANGKHRWLMSMPAGSGPADGNLRDEDRIPGVGRRIGIPKHNEKRRMRSKQQNKKRISRIMRINEKNIGQIRTEQIESNRIE